MALLLLVSSGSIIYFVVQSAEGTSDMRIIYLLLLASCLVGSSIAAGADRALELDKLRGRVIYLDFWASWCLPCRASFPFMNALQDSYGKQGLTVLAVDVDHDRADAQRFLQRYPADFRVLFDPDGRTAEAFQLMGMPTTVLIDRAGRVRYRHLGFQIDSRSQYEQEIRQLLNNG